MTSVNSRPYMVASFLALIGLLLASCTPAVAPTPRPAATPTAALPTAVPGAPTPTAIAKEEPRYGGTLRGLMADVTGCWDRHQQPLGPVSVAVGFVYSKLLEADYFDPDYIPSAPRQATMKYRGDLAESWEMPSDTSYIFRLHKGVKFDSRPPTNGREFTADDVIWTFKRSLTTPGSIKSVRDPIQSIEALDKYTVKFNLKYRYAPFLHDIANLWDVMVYAPETEKLDLCTWEAHRGTGAFKLVRFEPGVRAMYEKNPDYFGQDSRYPGKKLPYLDKVEMYVIPDPKSEVAALRAGQLDILTTSNLGAGIPRDDYLLLKDRMPQLSYNRFFSWGSTTAMRIDKSPFNDVRVRRAISMALDRKAMADVIGYGEGDPFQSVLLPQPWRIEGKDLGAAAQWYEYNPQKARQLLAEAGYPNGFKTRYTAPAGYKGGTFTKVMEMVGDYLSKVGIQTELEAIEFGAWNAKIYRSADYEGMAVVTSASHGPIAEWFNYLTKAGFNHSHVEDPKWEEMRAAFLAELNVDKQKEIAKEAQRYVADQVYYILHPFPKDIEAWWPHVKGYNGQAPRTLFGEYAKYIWIAK